jgi:hypothetical protein
MDTTKLREQLQENLITYLHGFDPYFLTDICEIVIQTFREAEDDS